MKYILKCNHCNQEFGSNRLKQKFCCEDCKSEFKEKSKIKKYCVNCDSIFYTTIKAKKFCCKECWYENLRKFNPTKLKIFEKKRCLGCYKFFMPNVINQKYCNKKCYPAIAKRIKVYENKNCIYCQKEFSTHMKYKVTCSYECSKEIQKMKYLQRKKKTTFHIFARDNFTCVYCGKNSYEDNIKLIVEHIYPRIKGGQNDIDNLITACSICNNQKGHKMLDVNHILKLWKIAANRNLEKKLNYVELKELFNKMYKVTVNA